MSVNIQALGVPVRIEVTGADRVAVEKSLSDAWAACVANEAPDALIYRVHLSDSADSDVPDGARLFRTVEQLMDSTTSGITHLAIDAQSRRLLMLHACGLADSSGRTIACVAASGTGKTTLAAAGAGMFRYASDETVGVHTDGSIEVYPKPLSVKAQPGPKTQVSPSDLGLEPWRASDAPPHLGKIVLLHREAGASTPIVAPVELFDAITELIPQISYLPRLASPLQRVASHIENTGGVVRVTYEEAHTVLPVLAGVLESTRATTSGGDGGDEETLARLREWTGDVGEHRSSLLYRATDIDDWLVRGGECLILRGQTVYRISAIGAALIAMTRHEALTLDEITDALVRHFGAPPDADPRALARDALVSLITSQLVEEINGSNVWPEGSDNNTGGGSRSVR